MGESRTLTLVLGGARSGKSLFAENLAEQLGERVLYVATAQSLDEEMRERVRKHRERRPERWRTLEAARQVGKAIRETVHPDEVILLDCLTLLVSNATLEGGEEASLEEAQPRVDAEIEDLLRVFQDHAAPVIVVSNEVGMGGVPLYPLGRVYQDLLGWANQQLAAEATQVYLMIAGLPVNIKQLSRDQKAHA
jgi:adenosylcobinamide kinase/adenosylcobinamide-phosphate guanylyltransferase